MKRKLLRSFFLLLAMLLLTSSALAAPAGGEQIHWTNLASGSGGPAVSPDFRMDMTVGQTVTGVAASPLYKVDLGYWAVIRPYVIVLPLVVRNP